MTTVLVVAGVLLWLRVGVAASRHWWAAETERLAQGRLEWHEDGRLPISEDWGSPEGVQIVLAVLGGPLYWCGPGLCAIGRAVRRYVTGADQ